ncbi:YgdI/YgdR family lipoprotein [Clostridium algidicarnis]|uniref:YgdI/YgdR family lipoprotein n=1 Tax=Clostridium algidicarnis TaxID=37659 RepID=UPI001C0E83D1|nr:YgdI/YgdR family lipoprotein [Clostridium algidicarnis]MBU3208537.1 YgdI/YgdR family lipoprotein [Clostridium algidicarnis]
MKRIITVSISLLILFTLVGCGSDTGTNNAVTDNTGTNVATSDDPKEGIKLKTEAIVKDMQSTSLKSIQVNDDAGRGTGYIVLVNLSFDAKNKPKTSKEMIDLHNSKLGEELAKIKDIQEIAVFWEVPYLNDSGNIAKANLQREGETMVFKEKWYAPVFK